MLAAERKDLLVPRLRREGKLVARDLAAEFGVSEDSVRRDLRDLAAARFVTQPTALREPRATIAGKFRAACK